MDLLQTACDDLRNANKFKDLLNVILMMGNFMNGSNYGGGAYGFKIGSINRVSPGQSSRTHANGPSQLVDTKSSNGLNLLHFLERTISQHFPDILEFRKELEKPAEAYRGMSPLHFRWTLLTPPSELRGHIFRYQGIANWLGKDQTGSG